MADVLREALAPLSSRISAAFVYGSMATGSDGPRSDVDVMVLGRASFAEVVGALAPVQATLGREVNATVMDTAEFSRRRKADDGFVAALQREPKIWLMGGELELG
jgi:predicted nucleotidyltransferase